MNSYTALSIMIVDDDPSTLTLFSALLSRAGHTVSTRDRAYGTVPDIIRVRPQIVLLDIGMPGLDGPEIVRVLRERGGYERPAIILFSNRNQADIDRVARDCGADGALAKTSDHRAFLLGFRTLLVQLRSRFATGT